MINPIENGTVHAVPDNAFGFEFKCHIPPFGYGISSISGKVLKTDVLPPASDMPDENYWEAVKPKLPSWWNDRRRKEKDVQRIDKLYVDPELEAIRKREWRRRIRGVWFWNYNPYSREVEAVYITGLQYLYCTYWKFQGKYMDFRMPDRDLFYVVEYCMQDPVCLGLNELTKRKNGKTARVGCWLYERTSRMKNHHGGLQSKTDNDAEKAFDKAIIQPWKKLPDFFRPRYDLLKGDEPSELKFFPTPRRGEKINEEDNENEEPLESFIDYESSTESAYDGPELHSYVSDEAGKTKKPVSIKERQNTVRYCTEIDYVMKGKHWYTTTVEPEKGEEENVEFQEMTANSNPLERDENGMTGTGLYTYFLPAHEGMLHDKYGFANSAIALQKIEATIKAFELKGDTRGLSSFKRKNPRTFKEAFAADGEFALYNPELLNQQWDNIAWTTKFTERGNLEWKDGYKVKIPVHQPDGSVEYKPSEVYWVPTIHGKFERIVGWEPRNPNNVYFDNITFRPNNSDLDMGCDPFKYDKTKDKRRSNCAAFAYQVPDPVYPDKYDDHFCLRYAFREESTRAANEDILKMAWWCGSEVLFERQVNHWKNDFNDWECAGFLAWIPGEVEPGINMSSDNIQSVCNYTESYINKHIKNVYFKTLIQKNTGWLGFKVEDTEKFDEPMAAGITLIKVRGKAYKRSGRLLSVEDFFPRYN
jgi:hypothetical protein